MNRTLLAHASAGTRGAGVRRDTKAMLAFRSNLRRCLTLARAGLVVLACGWVWGCGGPEASRGGESSMAAGKSAGSRAGVRLDAAWGRVIVVPAHSLPVRDAWATTVARTDDGQVVTIAWRTLRVTLGQSPAMPPTMRRGWLPPVGSWSTAGDEMAGETADVGGDGAGEVLSARFAVLTLPPGTLGQGVWISAEGSTGAGTRLEVNWLPSSRTLADRAASAAGGVGSPLSPEAAGSLLVRAALDAEGTSPFRRWRSRLGGGLLRPGEGGVAEAEEAAGLALDSFADAALEQIASQVEERWAVALALLGEADAGVASRVRTALLLTAPVGGVIAPVWTTDQEVLDELLGALLAPQGTARARLAAAEEYLRGVPQALARVADDAHALDAVTLCPVVVIVATNLTDRPVAASAVWPRSLAGADLTPVAARSAAWLVMPADADALDAKPSAGSVIVGDWRGTLRATPVASAVVPPGLFLGPFAADLSKDEWLMPAASGSVGGSVSGPVPIAVTLLRAPSANPRERSHAEGWVLYGESEAGATGTLRVWLGPQASGRSPIVVELGTAASPPAEAGTSAVQTPRRTFSVAVPADSITRGRLILGLDATIRRGEAESHWSWPRAMTPWQASPSRAALDLTAWGGVAAPAR